MSAEKQASEEYDVVSLFSGAMGLDLGFEATGRFKTLAAIEVDPACCETMRMNRDAGLTSNRDMRVYEADIVALPPERVMRDLGLEAGDLDVLIAGPPCQSFSTSGRRQGVQDVRGTLLWSVIDYLAAFRPKTFIIENVRGLVSAALKHRPIAERPEKGGPPLTPEELPGSLMAKFVEDMRARLGDDYRLDVFEVNAVNYGAPQLRERAVFVGNRLGKVVEFPAPTHGAEGAPFSTLGEALESLGHEENPILMDFSPRKKKYLAMVPPGGNWRCLPEPIQRESMGRAFSAKGGRSGWWRRLALDLPCPTIVTMPNHASTALTHPIEVRALTVGECAAVQEFPRGWRFSGKAQDQYRQVGNAVPVRLGTVAARALLECLEGQALLAACNDTASYRLVYLRSHVRTRQWFRGGESKVWRDGSDNRQVEYAAPVTLRRERMLQRA